MHANIVVARARPAFGAARRVAPALIAVAVVVALQSASITIPPAQSAAAAMAAATSSSWESSELAAATGPLLSRYAGNLPALGAAGQAALAAGRNEATVAAFLRLRWSSRLDAGLERFAPLLGSTDPNQLARGVAGVQRYSELIHSGLMLDGPDRLVTVSLQAQRLIAYDHGRIVLDTLVTTGRPALPTDVGAMRVVHKDSPWTMKSPWPKGSPYWYPDTVVQMVAWFTESGEGLHDAAWEPSSALGPGSQTGPFASHGCIHLAPAAEATLFGWLQIGTPVVVYPGDGSPLAVQAEQRSVDALGNPVTGTRGE
jgi:hypothetical protein